MGCDKYCQCGSRDAAAGPTGSTGATLDFFPNKVETFQTFIFFFFEELNCQNNGGVSFEPLLYVRR